MNLKNIEPAKKVTRQIIDKTNQFAKGLKQKIKFKKTKIKEKNYDEQKENKGFGNGFFKKVVDVLKIIIEKISLLIKKIKLNHIIFSFFCVFALIFLTYAIINTSTYAQFNAKISGYKKTIGTLDAVNTAQVEDEIIYEKSFVYVVEDKKYYKRVQIDDSNDYKLNETIPIYYKVTDPQKSEISSNPFSLVFAIVFYILFAVDLIFMFFYFRLRVKMPQTAQSELKELDENFEKMLNNIESSKEKLFQRNKKVPNKEKFVMQGENVYELKIKDINGNIVGEVKDAKINPSMAEATKIDTQNIKKQIDDKLNENMN